MNPMKTLLIIFSLLFFSQTAFAKRFTSQYCEFELPPGWHCQLEGTEWVCQSLNKDRKKEAIIILAAKIRGPQDSLDEYQAYLKKTKTFTLPGGKTQVSEAKYGKISDVNKHRWVDALHLASEVPGFYTRYLATVKEDLGVAVTFSVAKDHYAAYQNVFDKVVATLRVFRQKDANASKFALKGKDEDLFAKRDNQWIDGSGDKVDISQRRKGKAGAFGGATSYLIYALIAGGVAFAAMKLKSGKKKKKKKKKKSSDGE